MNNPDFSHTQWEVLKNKEIRDNTEEQIKRKAIGRVVRKFLVHLSADVNAARYYGGSFGSTIPMFQKLLTNRSQEINCVAFDMELPALDGLSTAQLIEVRNEYHDTFVRFRKRLGCFLEECLRKGITNPIEVRAKVKADLIDGEVEELRSSLARAEAALKRKSICALTLEASWQ
jgi:hypothetical protein